MKVSNLHNLLEHTAKHHGDSGLIFYLPGKTDVIGKQLKYSELLKQAAEKASFLRQLGLKPNSVILLHFSNHVDNIEWFWAVIYSGLIPAMSTPFANNLDQRKNHIDHLRDILNDPICLTRKELLPQFETQSSLRLCFVDVVQPMSPGPEEPVSQGEFKDSNDLAMLMLTSGSSGNAKAVCLTHGQILHSVASKSKEYGAGEAPLLNWVGFDHVACITETHLQAMFNGADQVMVQAEDLVPNPLLFLELISKHRIAASFAPNFFLASLRRAMEQHVVQGLDLSCLQCIVSGGEANVVETCVALSKLLEKYGAPNTALKPTFGMTETCAGAIYNRDCPRHDVELNSEFASVGSCIDGIEMRIVDDDGNEVEQDTGGHLEVSGPIVFAQYYNNPKATKESFNGKWFITGDRGFIDSAGSLHLTGRAKETVIINGVNYFPFEIEATLENIPGMKPSYTVVFPYRAKGAETESLCVVYRPTYASEAVDELVETNDAISKMILLQTSIRPYIVALDSLALQKSTLGKLSRAKIRASFEKGEYDAFQKSHDGALARYRASKYEAPTNVTEERILKAFETAFDLPECMFGVNTNMYTIGIDSIGLITFKLRLEKEFGILNIPIVTVMTNSTIRELAVALTELGKPRNYNPMVILRSQGSQTPLWLIHPGAGEVLVFLKLASYFEDRPVYAMRARGFEEGEAPFDSIDDVLDTYLARIKERQPKGPYALMGYSFGSMIAFELAKKIRAEDEVKLLGVLNLPPYIKFRMRQLDWTNCVLQLSYFLKLFSEEYAHSKYAELSQLPRQEALQHILSVGAVGRLAELGLDGPKLANWAEVAYRLQAAAVDYEPSGVVDNMDIFCAIPLTEVADNIEDWKTNHLSKWSEFSKEAPKFHDVDGSHYTMIDQENVYSFQKRLKSVLQDRGI